MTDFLFYLFAALSLLAAFMVVASRNAVNSAMFMILSFVGMAALFVLLEAYFLAVLQILIYAGAVVVLFLFVIMLLDIERVGKIKPKIFSLLGSGLALLLLVLGVWMLFASDESGPVPDPPTQTAASLSRNFGYELFTKYMLPFQVTGFLLLIAMVGVVLLSKKRARETADPSLTK